MVRGYFDIKRDTAVIKTGGFFCEAGLVGRPLDDRSPDPRYCLGCCEFLKAEAELVTRRKMRPKVGARSTTPTKKTKTNEKTGRPLNVIVDTIQQRFLGPPE